MKMLKGYIAGESLQTTYIAGLDEWNIRSSSWPIKPTSHNMALVQALNAVKNSPQL